MKIKLYTVQENAKGKGEGDQIFCTAWQARWYGRRAFTTTTYTRMEQHVSKDFVSHLVVVGTVIVLFFDGFLAIARAAEERNVQL